MLQGRISARVENAQRLSQFEYDYRVGLCEDNQERRFVLYDLGSHRWLSVAKDFPFEPDVGGTYPVRRASTRRRTAKECGHRQR